jgi:hypothetical protein
MSVEKIGIYSYDVSMLSCAIVLKPFGVDVALAELIVHVGYTQEIHCGKQRYSFFWKTRAHKCISVNDVFICFCCVPHESLVSLEDYLQQHPWFAALPEFIYLFLNDELMYGELNPVRVRSFGM